MERKDLSEERDEQADQAPEQSSAGMSDLGRRAAVERRREPLELAVGAEGDRSERAVVVLGEGDASGEEGPPADVAEERAEVAPELVRGLLGRSANAAGSAGFGGF